MVRGVGFRSRAEIDDYLDGVIESRGGVPLSSGEIERIKKEEFEKSRKMRIAQVRQQDRMLAITRRHKYEDELRQKKENKMRKIRLAWQVEKEAEIDSLKNKYRECLASIGNAHHLAVAAGHEKTASKVRRQASVARNRLQQNRRYEAALQVLREKQSKDPYFISKKDGERRGEVRDELAELQREKARKVAHLKEIQKVAEERQKEEDRKKKQAYLQTHDRVVGETYTVPNITPNVADFSETRFHAKIVIHPPVQPTDAFQEAGTRRETVQTQKEENESLEKTREIQAETRGKAAMNRIRMLRERVALEEDLGALAAAEKKSHIRNSNKKSLLLLRSMKARKELDDRKRVLEKAFEKSFIRKQRAQAGAPEMLAIIPEQQQTTNDSMGTVHVKWNSVINIPTAPESVTPSNGSWTTSGPPKSKVEAGSKQDEFVDETLDDEYLGHKDAHQGTQGSREGRKLTSQESEYDVSSVKSARGVHQTIPVQTQEYREGTPSGFDQTKMGGEFRNSGSGFDQTKTDDETQKPGSGFHTSGGKLSSGFDQTKTGDVFPKSGSDFHAPRGGLSSGFHQIKTDSEFQKSGGDFHHQAQKPTSDFHQTATDTAGNFHETQESRWRGQVTGRLHQTKTDGELQNSASDAYQTQESIAGDTPAREEANTDGEVQKLGSEFSISSQGRPNASSERTGRGFHQSRTDGDRQAGEGRGGEYNTGGPVSTTQTSGGQPVDENIPTGKGISTNYSDDYLDQGGESTGRTGAVHSHVSEVGSFVDSWQLGENSGFTSELRVGRVEAKREDGVLQEGLGSPFMDEETKKLLEESRAARNQANRRVQEILKVGRSFLEGTESTLEDVRDMAKQISTVEEQAGRGDSSFDDSELSISLADMSLHVKAAIAASAAARAASAAAAVETKSREGTFPTREQLEQSISAYLEEDSDDEEEEEQSMKAQRNEDAINRLAFSVLEELGGDFASNTAAVSVASSEVSSLQQYPLSPGASSSVASSSVASRDKEMSSSVPSRDKELFAEDDDWKDSTAFTNLLKTVETSFSKGAKPTEKEQTSDSLDWKHGKSITTVASQVDDFLRGGQQDASVLVFENADDQLEQHRISDTSWSTLGGNYDRGAEGDSVDSPPWYNPKTAERVVAGLTSFGVEKGRDSILSAPGAEQQQETNTSSQPSGSTDSLDSLREVQEALRLARVELIAATEARVWGSPTNSPKETETEVDNKTAYEEALFGSGSDHSSTSFIQEQHTFQTEEQAKGDSSTSAQTSTTEEGSLLASSHAFEITFTDSVVETRKLDKTAQEDQPRKADESLVKVSESTQGLAFEVDFTQTTTGSSLAEQRSQQFAERSSRRAAEAKAKALKIERERQAASSENKETVQRVTAPRVRLVSGERSKPGPKEQKKRTKRLYASLPEVVEQNKQKEAKKLAEERRKKVKEMEQKRRASLKKKR